MFKTLRTALCVLGALLPAALPSVATAGSYPVKPIQLIVPSVSYTHLTLPTNREV